MLLFINSLLALSILILTVQEKKSCALTFIWLWISAGLIYDSINVHVYGATIPDPNNPLNILLLCIFIFWYIFRIITYFYDENMKNKNND